MTQSTASKMLKDIEELLAAPLFERQPRGMTPTDLGLLATRFSEKMLCHLARFGEEFAERSGGSSGTLVVGAIMGAAPDLVTGAVADIKRELPLLTVRLLGETSDGILEMLEKGFVDLAVGRFSQSRHRRLFAFEPLGEEPLAFVVRAGHPLAGKSREGDLAALVRWPWIMQPPEVPTRKILEEAILAAGLAPPANQVESVSMFAILHLLRASDAVALLPVSVVADHLRSGLLARLSTPAPPALPGFGLLLRRDEPLSPQAERFRDLLRARCLGCAETTGTLDAPPPPR
jgi:DNA-binding transcriptional LysR family regulator